MAELPDDLKAMLRQALALSHQDSVAALPAVIIHHKSMRDDQKALVKQAKDSETLCAWMVDQLKGQLLEQEGRFTPQAVVMCRNRFIVFTMSLVLGSPEKLHMAIHALKGVVQKEKAIGIVMSTPSVVHTRPEGIPPFLYAMMAHAGMSMPGDKYGIHLLSEWRGCKAHRRFLGIKLDGEDLSKITSLIEDDDFTKEANDGRCGYTYEFGSFFAEAKEDAHG